MQNAKQNDVCALLRNNDYPGRGIIVGQSADDALILVYFIMGRSQNSQNRLFLETEEGLKIEPFDASKLEDPSLIIYYPYRHLGARHILTNGDQSDTVFSFLKAGQSFSDALATRCYEPDAPNFTPRISALAQLQEGRLSYTLSILKKQAGEGCTRQFFHYEGESGLGHFIHTYACDGNPLPSFQGEPICVRMEEDVQAFAESIFAALSPDKRISIFAKKISLCGENTQSVIINGKERLP